MTTNQSTTLVPPLEYCMTRGQVCLWRKPQEHPEAHPVVKDVYLPSVSHGNLHKHVVPIKSSLQ